MPAKTYRATIRDTIAQEMWRDPSIVVIGEDVAGGMGGSGESDSWGGAQRILQGLVSEFGRDRVIDTPISETAFLGAAAAAASTGLRPVVEIMFVDFFGVCFDQLLNNIAKFRYMSGGQISTPITIRATYGAGLRAGAQHMQSLLPIFAHIPGIKVAVPSSAKAVKGLLAQAIRDDDPVLVCEHRMLLNTIDDVPDGDFLIPFGQAATLRPGTDVTVVAIGAMVGKALSAAETLNTQGISCEVIDPQTISPLDFVTIAASVARTGHLVAVDESNPRCGLAVEIVGEMAMRLGPALRAATTVTAPHTPIPFAGVLEDVYIPSAERIVIAVQSILRRL